MVRTMPLVRIEGDKIRSLKIEYNLTDHCNYGCDECSHFSPYLTRKESSLEGFKKDLEALAQVIRVYRFRFVGGEPLLHRDILGHIAALRESGIAGEVQICTNGALLDRVPEAVFAAIDSLSISWYPDPRCDQAKVDRAVSACERVGTRVGVHKIDTFRQMQVGRPLTDRALVQEVYNSCHIAHRWYCQTFYEGRLYLWFSRTSGAAHARRYQGKALRCLAFADSYTAPITNRQQARSRPRTSFFFNRITALARLQLHRKCGRTEVTRYELPLLGALNFVPRSALRA